MKVRHLRQTHFSSEDFRVFSKNLRLETMTLLSKAHKEKTLFNTGLVHISEDTFLLDENNQPLCRSDLILESESSSYTSPGLGKFSVQLHSLPQKRGSHFLSQTQRVLEKHKKQVQDLLQERKYKTVSIGTMPFVQLEDLSSDNMTKTEFFIALNQQLLKMRKNRPVEINIHGQEHLQIVHPNLMLSAMTGSFRFDMELPTENAVRFYNAAQIALAPVLAIAANSPFFMGKNLWNETRIPLFEQTHLIDSEEDVTGTAFSRVIFGSGYMKNSFAEHFLENERCYAPILPQTFNEDTENFKHLCLHNETIWRWNRILIEMGDCFQHDRPNLKLEVRALPAGPTVLDNVANMAFFLGLTQQLANEEVPPESMLFFSEVKENFYQAARHGLNSHMIWKSGSSMYVTELILEKLIPLAKKGLLKYGLDVAEIDFYLDEIIFERTRSRQTGSSWQQRFVAKYGTDFKNLLRMYLENQSSHQPVHTWGF